MRDEHDTVGLNYPDLIYAINDTVSLVDRVTGVFFGHPVWQGVLDVTREECAEAGVELMYLYSKLGKGDERRFSVTGSLHRLAAVDRGGAIRAVARIKFLMAGGHDAESTGE